jgi:hypothetical protein
MRGCLLIDYQPKGAQQGAECECMVFFAHLAILFTQTTNTTQAISPAIGLLNAGSKAERRAPRWKEQLLATAERFQLGVGLKQGMEIIFSA